jgi:hypothetical protein
VGRLHFIHRKRERHHRNPKIQRHR